MIYDRREDPGRWHRSFVVLALLEDRTGKWYQRLAFCRTVWRRLSDQTMDIAGQTIHRYQHRESKPA